MEMKHIVLVSTLLLVGCGPKPITIRTETQDVFIPVPYCPVPPPVVRPDLALDPIRDGRQMSDGELAKAYHATIVELQGYANELESIINEYDEVSKTNKTLEEAIAERPKKVEPQ